MKRSRKQEGEKQLITEKPLPKTTFFREKVSDFLIRLFSGVDIAFEGEENLNLIHGPAIFALAPHNGHTDHPVLMRALRKADRQLRKKVFIVSAAGYWDAPVLKQASQWIIRNMPFERKRSDQMMEDKRIIGEHIRNGDLPIVWVEGTRKNHGKPMRERKIKTGAVQFAIDTRDVGTVVVPVYLGGAEDMMPPGSSWFKVRPRPFQPKFKIKVVFGKPITIADKIPDNYDELHVKKQFGILRELTALLQAFYVAQEEFEDRLNQDVPDY